MSNHPKYASKYATSRHEFSNAAEYDTYVITDIAGMKQIFLERVLTMHPDLSEGQVKVEIEWNENGTLKGMKFTNTKPLYDVICSTCKKRIGEGCECNE